MKSDKCYFCSETNEDMLEQHHILPRRDGGTDRDKNLVTVCASCHNGLEHLYDRDFYSRFGVKSRKQHVKNASKLKDDEFERRGLVISHTDDAETVHDMCASKVLNRSDAKDTMKTMTRCKELAGPREVICVLERCFTEHKLFLDCLDRIAHEIYQSDLDAYVLGYSDKKGFWWADFDGRKHDWSNLSKLSDAGKDKGDIDWEARGLRFY